MEVHLVWECALGEVCVCVCVCGGFAGYWKCCSEEVKCGGKKEGNARTNEVDR